MASLTRSLVAVVLVAIAAGAVYPLFASGPDLDQAALALALAGPAAGAALAAAAGRPLLAAAALSGAGAYTSGLLAEHGVAVAVAIVCGSAAGAAAGSLLALLAARADGPAFLLATLLLAVSAGDAVQALPGVTGAQSGLGPLPPLSLPLEPRHTLVLTPVGNFHVLLGVAVLSMDVAALLLWRGPGPRWRAVGSDRARAASTGLGPLVAEMGVLALAGLMAALSGALAAHVEGSADPQSFAVDVAALPLLAALAAGRHPLGAGLVAVATGVVGRLVLPAVGWHGPPSGQALALGVLALGALFSLVPGGAPQEQPSAAEVDPTSPWPLDKQRGARLTTAALAVRSAGGRLLVDAPPVTAEPGRVTAIVGPNGAGKTTWLRAVAERARRRGLGVEAGGSVELLPQSGGGFAACTARETLELAARGSRRGAPREAAELWLRRLGLAGRSSALCAELSAGERRLVDLARALLTEPAVLLLDEPLAGLDEEHRAAATSCLHAAAAAGMTVVLSEHDRAAVAQLASTVVELTPPP